MDSSRRSMTPSVEVPRCFSSTSAFAAGVLACDVGKSASSETDSSFLSIFAISFVQSRSLTRLLSLGDSSGSRLSRERVALDLLVQIGPRHVQRASGFRDVPVELAQLREQERPLGGVLELLERLALEQRAQSRLLRVAAPNETRHVVGADARARREDQETLDRVSELANIAGPVETL